MGQWGEGMADDYDSNQCCAELRSNNCVSVNVVAGWRPAPPNCVPSPPIVPLACVASSAVAEAADPQTVLMLDDAEAIKKTIANK